MTRSILFLLLIGCSSDVSIMKTNQNDDLKTDTSVTSDTDIENQPDNTGEPSAETEYSDLTIGYGEIKFRQVACPACVGETSEFDITATLKLHQPTSGNYIDNLTPVGTCSTNLFETHVSSQPLSSTQQAYFNGITLAPVGSGEWHNSYLYEHQYERNASHSVSSEHGTIADAFVTIEGFDSINPYTLLWVDPSYAFEAVISKSGTTFSWAPSLPNTQFEIIIAAYTPDGSQFLGAVSCMENDLGSMFIPGTYFQSYPHWSLVAVHFLRHKIGMSPSEELNGNFQSHMIWEVVGTGHIE